MANERKLLDFIADAAREGAEAVGVPCTACFLFSNRGVSVLDIAADLTPTPVHEIAGDSAVPALPFVTSVIGPRGLWTKTTQKPGASVLQ